MKKILLIAIVLLNSIFVYAKSLDQKIANMFVVGFYGTTASRNSKVIDDICYKGLGGVLLFDRHPTKRGKAKNISSPSQLKKLTHELTSRCSHKPLIAIDQEGGKVQRLLSKNGFYGKYPKAASLGKANMSVAKNAYSRMSNELSALGINFNLAPVADMAVNSRNRVIYRLGRSYGADPKRVAYFNKIFINAMHRGGILTSLKHFPGHGSSMGDTHKGFVDVSKSWNKKELEPFRLLIKSGKVDSIMVAHVFNSHMDSRYPASLSQKTVTGVLRGKLGYSGVVISDDLQMYAISKHYNLKNTIMLAINAGVDILLFGNQLDPSREVSLNRLVSVVKKLLAEGRISISSINNANRRIDSMRSKIGL